MIEIQGAMHIFVLYLGEDAQMPVQYARWEIPVDTQRNVMNVCQE